MELNLNDSITQVDAHAFNGCTKLDTFDLPTSTTTLGVYAMANCDALTDMEIPTGVTVINDAVFYDCDSLRNVKLHSEITNIRRNAFYGCDNLQNVDLPENLTTIGYYAFENCTSFTTIVIPNKVTSIGVNAFKGCSNVTKLTIGEKVSIIGANAFQNLSKVQSVTVPNSVASIGSSAFAGCSSLVEISLPFVGAGRTLPTTDSYGSSYGISGQNYVFGYIFGSASYTGGTKTAQNWGYYKYTGKHLVEFDNQGKSYYTDGSYSSLSSLPADYYAYYYGSYYYYTYGAAVNTATYYIPTTLKKVTITDADNIYFGAFSNCGNIVELNLNDSITQVDDYAFHKLGMITNSTEEFVISGDILLYYNAQGASQNVVVPNGIEIIAPRAFYKNVSISCVQLPDDTYYIGAGAFYKCTNAIVNVPKIYGVLTIDTGAFQKTGSVKYLDKSSYTNGNDTYYYNVDANGNATIVDCETTSVNITLPVTLGGYTVTTVGYRGMADCTTLSAITIPNNITRLELYAFAGCTGLDVVTIPATCVYVGEHAFSGCSAMTTAIISEGVLYLGDYAFENCVSLTEIVVPDSCEYLGKYAFYNCVSMESASVGNSTPAIQEYTFYNCAKLKTIVVGIKVESIGDYAFYNTALTTLYLHQLPNLKTIGDYAFV